MALMEKSRIPSQVLSEAGVQVGRLWERVREGWGKGRPPVTALGPLLLVCPLPPLGRLFRSLAKPETQAGTAQERSLLAQLKALVVECDAHGTDGLLSKVRTLVSSQINANASPDPPSRAVAAVAPPAVTAQAGCRCP